MPSIIFCNGSLILGSNSHHFIDGQDAVNDIKSIKRRSGASDTVGLFTRTGRGDLGIGIAHIGIFKFFGIRCIEDIKDETRRGNMVSEQF